MPNRLGRARSEFERRITEAEKFVVRCQTAKNTLRNRPLLVTTQIEWVYEAATLKMIVASEQFFELTLGLYVLGHKSPTGFRPRRLAVVNSSLSAMLGVLRGDQPFVGWNEPSAVIKRAERWLRNGDPYQNTLSAASQLLSYLKKMRDVIAHESDNALEKYEKATRRLYGALPRRVSPGAQLIQPVPAGLANLAGASLFQASADAYRVVAKGIVP